MSNAPATAILRSAPLWSLEHEIALRYFGSDRRTLAADKKWIGHQMFKEWTGSGVYGPRSTTVATMISEVAAQIADLDRGGVAPAPLRSTCVKLSFASDELRHYAQLHDLYLLVEPDQAPPAISELGILTEGRKLTELRLRWREDPIGEVAVDLSEGGGLGLYFGIRSAATLLDPSNPIDREIIQVAERTITDESQHILGRFRNAESRNLSDPEWETVSEILHEISIQKLRERNEQFGNPLTEAEMTADITPERTESSMTFLKTHLPFLLNELGIN